ncbi:peptidase S8/S53 domain-containing protein [Schizophyllum amplum]|uniref:Peptidase S8/S53 domain-containing protein n=1 Tax=Schizophyllum amplum TaxID=97359 RepID=A0A550CVX6_9AGAR|nr:peptidase S8/S53 domain-containing protein [Auriculariopsis ampla]
MPSFIRSSVYAATLAAVAYASPLSTSHSTERASSSLSLAPLVLAEQPHKTVDNSYIVMLKDNVHSALMENHLNFLQMAHAEDPLLDDLSGLQQVYDGHVRGYSGRFTERLIQQLRTMPEVDYIEQDQLVHTMDMDVGEMDMQKNATWGLARISHRDRLRLSTFTKYEYDPTAGEGVDVYVVDTGINVNHIEFDGRASWGKTIPQNDVDEDGNGHGTHCAGTIASKSYGVSKAANVIAVKVLGSNGSGSMSDVVGGVVWAATQAQKKAAEAAAELAATGSTKHKGSVANMSLGGGKSRALDDAVNRAVDAGLHFAVAAGNDNRDACSYSPAAAEKAVTVGASTFQDDRAYFSNHGPCVDVFAPGLNIKSTYIGSKYAVSTLSGTSMASPHVAGLLAYLLSIYPSASFNPNVEEPKVMLFNDAPLAQAQKTFFAVARNILSTFLPIAPSAEALFAPVPKDPKPLSPSQLKQALIDLSTSGVLEDLPSGTPNLLVFNNATSA